MRGESALRRQGEVFDMLAKTTCGAGAEASRAAVLSKMIAHGKLQRACRLRRHDGDKTLRTLPGTPLRADPE